MGKMGINLRVRVEGYGVNVTHVANPNGEIQGWRHNVEVKGV